MTLITFEIFNLYNIDGLLTAVILPTYKFGIISV